MRRAWWLGDEAGQGTVEYAVVFVGLVALVAALGVLARAGEYGTLNDAANSTFSHSIEGSALLGGFADAVLY